MKKWIKFKRMIWKNATRIGAMITAWILAILIMFIIFIYVFLLFIYVCFTIIIVTLANKDEKDIHA